MEGADESWLRRALGGWDIARRRFLNGRAHSIDRIVTYDGRCSYTVAGGMRVRPDWIAAQHQGEVILPNGARVPAGPNSFNAASEGRNFVVMSLPSIWRPVAPKSDIPLELYLESIMLHELTHSYQSVVSPSLSWPALLHKYSLPENTNDDSIQVKYERDPAYVRDYEAERNLLFHAAAAPSEAGARRLACDALAKLRERRARYFHAENWVWSMVDEVSLTSEGLGEWVGYSWLTRVRRIPASVVLPRFRGHYWSQEHGLALFLVIDRLVPGWQKLLLRGEPETVEPLLARACRARRSGR